MAENSIPKTSGIYKITCTANGKIYVGSSNDISIRWHHHKKALRKGKHHSIYMQRCWSKYGEQSFVIEVIELVMPSSLLEREQYWLDKIKPFGQKGFNTNHKVTGGKNFGYKHKPETIEKIRTSHIGIKASNETRAKQSAAKKGKRLSLDHAAKISRSNKGRIHTPQARALISAKLMGHLGAMKGRKLTVEQVEKVRNHFNQKWIVTNPDGESFEIIGLSQFCRENNLSQGHMHSVASGKRNHHKGWKCKHG